jgi:hypothetical protein
MNDAISARTFAGVLNYRGALWNQREYFERIKCLLGDIANQAVAQRRSGDALRVRSGAQGTLLTNQLTLVPDNSFT